MTGHYWFAASSYEVVSRTRDLAIMSALGAQRYELLWFIGRSTAIACGAGAIVGALVGAYAADRAATIIGVGKHSVVALGVWAAFITALAIVTAIVSRLSVVASVNIARTLNDA